MNFFAQTKSLQSRIEASITLPSTDGCVLDGVTPDERQAIRQAGAFDVELGGTITQADPLTGEITTFSMPSKVVSLPADFPVRQNFPVSGPFTDADGAALAQRQADAWLASSRMRISAAVSRLRQTLQFVEDKSQVFADATTGVIPPAPLSISSLFN